MNNYINVMKDKSDFNLTLFKYLFILNIVGFKLRILIYIIRNLSKL